MADPVLVTGATGFLGARLCRELDDRGWRVRGLRRESSTVDGLSDVDVEWRTGDVRRPDDVAAAVAGCGSVCHLAGIGLMDASPETVSEVNVEGTRHVLDACEREGVERLVFTSTAGTRRRDGGVADESDRAPPVGAYQRSKAEAERLVRERVERGLDAVVVLPTSVFGPGDAKFTARLLKLATDPKLFAYLPGGASIVGVGDVARGHVAALERGRTGECYVLGGENLAYGEALAVVARAADGSRPRVQVPRAVVHAMGPVAGAVGRWTGRRVFPFTAEMARLSTRELFYSSAKAEEHLGYEYEPLRDLVDDAVAWFRRTRWGIVDGRRPGEREETGRRESRGDRSG